MLLVSLVFIFLALSAANVSGATPPAEGNILLTALELKREMAANSRVMAVDVRNASSFAKARIPRSVNIPLHFVKTKTYLRNLRIVLVNEGYFLAELLVEAKELRAQGYDAHVLAGGLAAWQAGVDEFVGVDLAITSEFRYMPVHYLLSRHGLSAFEYGIDISPVSEKAAVQEQQGEALALRTFHAPIESREDLSPLRTVLKDHKTEKTGGVLVFNSDGNYSLVADAPDTAEQTIFFLKGGLEAYQRILVDHQAMWQPKSERLKKYGGCPTCQKSNDDIEELIR
jgi:rhodanese-related sulfurtransferase